MTGDLCIIVVTDFEFKALYTNPVTDFCDIPGWMEKVSLI